LARASKRIVVVPSGVWRIIEGNKKDMLLVPLSRRVGFGNLVGYSLARILSKEGFVL